MTNKSRMLFLAASVCFAGTVSAQNEYRMLIKNDSGTKGYYVDRVEEVSFAKVEGEVKANVTVNEVALDYLMVTVERTEACRGFRIAVMPRSIAGAYSNYPSSMVDYVEKEGSSILTEDFINGRLSGIELAAASDYSCVTVGYDEYGIACEICRDDFTTPAAPLVGNPKVTTTVKSVGKYDFTVHCVPNDDVKGYACVAGEAGTMQAQYEMYAAWFGFTNFGDMIRGWGIEEHNAKDISWNDMTPGTDYEVFVQPWDENDTYAECDVVSLRTESLGGTGEAKVDITLGDYKMQQWGEEMLPSQFITFTPSNQASCYRYQVMTVTGTATDGTTWNYNDQKDAIWNELKQDPPQQNMMYWFFYETLTTDFQINPNTACVAIASAKNANGEWGPVTEVFFTTPATAANMPASTKVQARQISQKPTIKANRIPVLRQNKISIK